MGKTPRAHIISSSTCHISACCPVTLSFARDHASVAISRLPMSACLAASRTASVRSRTSCNARHMSQRRAPISDKHSLRRQNSHEFDLSHYQEELFRTLALSGGPQFGDFIDGGNYVHGVEGNFFGLGALDNHQNLLDAIAPVQVLVQIELLTRWWPPTILAPPLR